MAERSQGEELLGIRQRTPWPCALIQRCPWMQSSWLPSSLELSVEAPMYLADRGGEEREGEGGGGWGPQGPERAVQWGHRPGCSQGHIGRSSSSSDRPSIREESRDPGPTRDRAISLTSQGLRARLPPERPSAASSRSLPSLARWFARSLSCSLSRSGTSPRPPLARRPRLLLTRPSPAPGAARPEPRRAARPPGAAALILLPRSLCLDPSAWIPLPEPRCTNSSVCLSGPRSGIRLLGAFCPSFSLSPWIALPDSGCLNPSAWTLPHGSLCLDRPHGSLCAFTSSVATMPVARPQAAGPDRISLLLVAFLLGSPAAAQADGKHPEGPGPKRVKLLWLTRAVGGLGWSGNTRATRGTARIPGWAPRPCRSAEAGTHLKDSRLRLRVLRLSLGWGQTPFCSLEKLPGEAPRSGVLSKPSDSGSSLQLHPGLAARLFCQALWKRIGIGSGKLTACFQNQIPSHPTIPRCLGLSGGAVSWLGPSQVSGNWTWVWLLRMVGSSGLPELGEKREVRTSGSGSLLSFYSLINIRNEERVLVKPTCLLLRKGV